MRSILRHGMGVALGALLMAAIMVATQAQAQGWVRDQAQDQPTPAVAVAAKVVTIAAEAPRTIHYQGQLFNPNTNQPLANQSFTVRFALYGDANGTNAVWGEQKTIPTNVDGMFNTQLGDTVGFNLGLFDGRELYLEIAVNNETTRPLQPFTYVPYALWARSADRLDGFDSGDFAKIVAYGFVDDDGGRESGSNFSSSRATLGDQDVYLIDIGGVDYQFRQFTTLVTPACEQPVMVGTGSVRGDLIVDIWDQNGNRVKCHFQFMTLRRE